MSNPWWVAIEDDAEAAKKRRKDVPLNACEHALVNHEKVSIKEPGLSFMISRATRSVLGNAVENVIIFVFLQAGGGNYGDAVYKYSELFI